MEPVEDAGAFACDADAPRAKSSSSSCRGKTTPGTAIPLGMTSPVIRYSVISFAAVRNMFIVSTSFSEAKMEPSRAFSGEKPVPVNAIAAEIRGYG